MSAPSAATLIILVIASALTSSLLIMLLRPLLIRYALARPNARSSHLEPTPQGGGIAVIGATVLVLAGLLVVAPTLLGEPLRLGALFTATTGLALTGAVDDIRPLSAPLRLVLQFAAVGLVIAALPDDVRAVPQFPLWLERAALLIGGVWFVNLVNFMDGIDWITVAEVVPITAALVVFGGIGALPPEGTLVAMALCGGMIGFAPFNRPVARLFLGDVGSLPIGLLLTWLLTLLAGSGHLAAALLLPLYYLADATLTLLRRAAKGEKVTTAHRSHFYQRALDNGFSVSEVVARVFVTNLVLIALATVTLVQNGMLHVAALAAGGVVVAVLLVHLSGRR
jgi:UDP-N-acetylmuramyl pentapeptide phosphotransferase/UDP-N-acetylglucosamine-1-phosphate transferase